MLRRCRVAILSSVVLLSAVPTAQADRVHLAGGGVIEGKVTKQGRKVMVELAFGQLTLPVETVKRIESSPSDVQSFEERYAKLNPGDVAGLMALADFCRDHDMSERERQVLQKVIETAPDRKEARARLGYARTEAGWITREEQYKAQGMVQYEGQWVTRQQMLERESAKDQAEIAARERVKAQVEQETRRAALLQERADQEVVEARAWNKAMQLQAAQRGYYPAYMTNTTTHYPTPGNFSSPYSGWVYRAPVARRGPVPYVEPPCPRTPAGAPHHAAFPIPGVKDPFDYFR
jgi:hypothetical protein